MKNIQKIFLVMIMAVALLCPMRSYADIQPAAAPRLTEYAKRLIQDVDDEDARTYFRQIVKEQSGISESAKLKILRLSELLSYLDFLRQRATNLKGAEEQVDLANHKTGYAEYSIDDLVARLSAVKDELVEAIQQKQLERVQLKPKEILSESRPAVSASDQLEAVNVMRAEVRKLRESFNGLQGRVKAAEERTQHLTDDLAAKTLESFEKEQIIARQKQDLIDLEQKLEETKERFTLGQQLLREKNNKIEALEGSEAVAVPEGPVADITELKNKFAALQLQFNEQVKTNKVRLGIVEGLLAEQEKRMAQYTFDLRAKGEQLDSLTNLVLEKSKQLSELNAVLASKDEKLLELGGIIQIYKDKLTESNKLLKERVKELEASEDKITGEAQGMSFTQSNLRSVDDQLILLREHLKELP